MNIFFLFLLFSLFFQNLKSLENDEKKFVILILSYNNEKYVEKNLYSALDQNYNNYRIIYVDDASVDNTLERVKFMKSAFPEKNFTVIHNIKNRGAMANLNKVVRQLDDDEIVVILDGDDWFARNDVLKILNIYYKDPNVWLTYGSYINLQDGKRGEFSSKLPQEWILGKNYRKNKWLTSHLRTFYAGLYKHIRECDLMKDGEFLKAAPDLAIMFPMLEMADGRFSHIDEILYVYNNITEINEHRRWPRLQAEIESFLRGKKPYSRLDSLFISKGLQN